jgi:alkylation response protein AidB-like acyl-CoA dehydrogenase
MLHGSDLLANIGEISRRFAADRRRRQQRRELDPLDIIALKDAGFHLSAVPEDHGGWWQSPQRSVRAQCDALRLLAQGDASVALVASMHPSVLTFWRDPDPPKTGGPAWEKQKRQVFGTVIDNAWWGTITSEPGSGGDISQTRARAVEATEVPGRYLLSGEKHFGSGSGATTHMLTTARRDHADAPNWFFIDVRAASGGGATGMSLKAAWDGHGMAATNSHAYIFKDCPATQMAWPGSWRDVMNATGGAGTMANTAPFVGIIDAAMQHMREEFARRGQRPEDLRAFERIEWAAAHRETWLLYQAYNGALLAIERKGRAIQEAVLAKTTIAVLAESILTRLCRISGGGAYARHSPLGFWFEDVRALGFLRPPWSLACEGLLALSSFGEPGAMRSSVDTTVSI